MATKFRKAIRIQFECRIEEIRRKRFQRRDAGNAEKGEDDPGVTSVLVPWSATAKPRGELNSHREATGGDEENVCRVADVEDADAEDQQIGDCEIECAPEDVDDWRRKAFAGRFCEWAREWMAGYAAYEVGDCVDEKCAAEEVDDVCVPRQKYAPVLRSHSISFVGIAPASSRLMEETNGSNGRTAPGSANPAPRFLFCGFAGEIAFAGLHFIIFVSDFHF
jgi:hypothetical protein